jgi:hypothetical protein
MPRSSSHSAGFAKREAGAQSSEWKNETAKSEVSSKLFPMRSRKMRSRKSAGRAIKKEEGGKAKVEGRIRKEEGEGSEEVISDR